MSKEINKVEKKENIEIGTFELSNGKLVDIPLNKDYKKILAK